MKNELIEALEEVFDDLVLDMGDCRLDHHGYCQEHSWFSLDKPCPVKRYKEIKQALAAAKPEAHKKLKQVGWFWLEGVSTGDYKTMFQPYHSDDKKSTKWFVEHKWQPMFIQAEAQSGEPGRVPHVVTLLDSSTIVDAMSRHFREPPPLDELYQAAGGVMHVLQDAIEKNNDEQTGEMVSREEISDLAIELASSAEKWADGESGGNYGGGGAGK